MQCTHARYLSVMYHSLLRTFRPFGELRFSAVSVHDPHLITPRCTPRHRKSRRARTSTSTSTSPNVPLFKEAKGQDDRLSHRTDLLRGRYSTQSSPSYCVLLHACTSPSFNTNHERQGPSEREREREREEVQFYHVAFPVLCDTLYRGHVRLPRAPIASLRNPLAQMAHASPVLSLVFVLVLGP